MLKPARYFLIIIYIIGICLYVGPVEAVLCPVGDLDGDCKVNLVDLHLMALRWLDGGCGAPTCVVDLDDKPGVNLGDYSVLAENWQETGITLLINEFMASNATNLEDPDEPGEYPDWIEIYNIGDFDVNMGGLYITDNLGNPFKWQIPAGTPAETTVAAGNYLLLWADEDPEQGPRHVNIKLGASGEEIGLFTSDGVVVDSIVFGAQNTDESYGRYPNGSDSWIVFLSEATTPGESNGGEVVSEDIIITEIMYHPYHDETVYEPEPVLEEYIEIYNTSILPINLEGWRFYDGVDFTFPNVTIGAGEYLVVAADVATFSAKYPSVTNIIGGWSGKLRNKGEKIDLVDIAGKLIDSVSYADEGEWAVRELGPVDELHRGWSWSNDHDGLGKSLELINISVSNEYGQNWSASTVTDGTPGVANSVADSDIAPLILDVENDPVIPRSTDAVTITAYIIDELSSGITATLYYRIDTSVYINENTYPTHNPASYTSVVMYDDGLHNDGLAGDGVYGAEIPAQADGSIIELYVEASDSGANSRTWPPPSDMSSIGAGMQQVTNLLYQVDDSYDPEAQWSAQDNPIFYLIMTEMERGRLADIGDDMSDERYSDAQMNGTFISIDGVDMKRRYIVGIRNRGEGSRGVPPNNYRVNFRHDDPWKNITAININSKYTYLQVTGSVLSQMADLPAAEASAVRVRVNGENLALTDTSRMYGAYAWLEVFDGDWTENHIPDDSGGNMYKAAYADGWNADLSYLGTNPADYEDDGYFKLTNESENDWTDLFDLTNVLDNEPDVTYVEEVNRVLNAEQWMRWFAFNAILGNNENGLATGYGEDYRIYRGIVDPHFHLVIHDLDTILYVAHSIPSTSRTIFYAADRVPGSVIGRFIKHPVFVRYYYAQLKELTETVFTAEQFEPIIDQVLSGWVPPSMVSEIKQKMVERIGYVLQEIPLDFSISSSLSTMNGFYYTTSGVTSLTGTANSIETYAVRINGVLADDWSVLDGEWSIGSSISLNPGINRVIVETFDDPNGTGNVLESGYIDIWYDDGDETIVSGTISSNTTWDAASGPWHVTGEITVQGGATLTIEPGTTVFFDSGVGITVNYDGRLIAQGLPYERIRLTRVPGGANWRGLDFSATDINPGTMENRLTYLDHDYGDSKDNSVNIGYSKVFIDKVMWEGTNTRVLEISHPSLEVYNSYIPSVNAEPIHGSWVENNEYVIFKGCVIDVGVADNDIIDWANGDRDTGARFLLINNTFLGGGDDGADVDATDTYIEGNIFTNFHIVGTETTSNAVACGDESSGHDGELVIIRNIFYDNDHAILLKENASGIIINNVFVDSTDAAVQFAEYPGRDFDGPGSGAYMDGNIFWGYGTMPIKYLTQQGLPYPWTTDPVVELHNSIITDEAFPGSENLTVSGNIDADPLFVDQTSDFHLLVSSPAVGTGPNGADMGKYIPAGASVLGEPYTITHHTDAILTVGGPAITHYKYRLMDNGGWAGGWSAEYPVATPISLSGLTDGHTYQVYVLGKNTEGLWPGDLNSLLPADPGGNPSRSWTVDTSYQRLVISEVLARNVSAVNHEGSFPDIVELYYDGPTTLNLTNMSISDDPAEPTKYVFTPGTTIEPDNYLVLYDDANMVTSGIHLNFALNADGEGVYLYDTPANGGGLIDSVEFGNQLADLSVGRVGPEQNWTLTQPTPGAANIAEPTGNPYTLKINEWLANGEILFEDDFIEIYNPHAAPVNLGGMYLTDNPLTQPDKYQIHPLSFAAGEGYIVFQADDSNRSGHVDFRLSAEREMIALYDCELNEIDKIVYGPQTTDVSQGRSPDGDDNLEFFTLPTPGAANTGISSTVTEYNLIDIEDVWSYDQSGTDLGTAWRNFNLPFDEASNLIAHWKFDDATGSTAADSSTNGYNGTLINFPTDDSQWVTGRENGALQFNGTDDYVDLGTFDGLNGATQFTISFWIKPDQLPFADHKGIIGIGSTGQRAPWIWGAGGASNLRMQFETTTGGISDCDLALGDVEQGQWTHIVITWDGGTCTSYINGVLDNSDTTNGDTLVNSDGTNYLGYINGYGYWDGTIDDIRIYNRVLSKDEIEWIWTEGWPSGAALLYVESSSLPAPKNTLLNLYGENGTGSQITTFYFRKHFTFSGEPNAVTSMELATVVDDGAAIYLNGEEMLDPRLRLPGVFGQDDIDYQTFTTGSAVDNAVYEYFSIPIDTEHFHLQQGDNVIAVEVHQATSGSSDIVFGLELDAVTTNIYQDDPYTVGREVLEGLRITELMYNHPEGSDYEFIELRNIGATTLDLTGVRFTDGIDFTFPAMMLDAGQYVVVVDNINSFQERFGASINIAGQYSGNLNDTGEKIVLQLAAPLSAAVMRFEYSNTWYPSTDGGGYSLVIIDPSAEPATWDEPASWRTSGYLEGSPGWDEQDLPAHGALVINEVLAHSHGGNPDWIEIYNTTDEQINLSGWFLSDSDDDDPNRMKYEIAPGTMIDPNDYLVFYEDTQFGNLSDPACHTPFALSENGETVYLHSNLTHSGALVGYSVAEDFGASETDIAFGRYRKSNGSYNFVAMSANTPGNPNAYPKVGPVVIKEIMYHPPGGGSYDNEEYEYIELYNISGAEVTLYDVMEAESWKFTDGIEFTFPAMTTIPTDGYLLVVKNPVAFAERYGTIPGVEILGPFENGTRLDNAGEKLELSMPGDVDGLGVRQYIRIDRVNYDDADPWPTSPDGTGDSLERIGAELYGNDVINWQAASPSPGQ